MLLLNKYLINEIAQQTGHPHRLRVCRKLRDAINLNIPPSIMHHGVRVFLPMQHFPNYPSFDLVQEKIYDKKISFSPNKNIFIYTCFTPDNEDITKIIKNWNQKFPCTYIHSSVTNDLLKDHIYGIYICESGYNGLQILYKITSTIFKTNNTFYVSIDDAKVDNFITFFNLI